MRGQRIKLPELALIAATRGMLGFGAGLLASRHISAKRTRSVGLGLVIAGVVSTIPIAYRLFKKRRAEPEQQDDAMDAVPFVEVEAAPIIITELVP